VVYPAIDYIFMKTSDNVGVPRENTVLCTGRFTKLKRQDFLLRTFRKIREKVRDATLTVAGYCDVRHSHFLKTLLDSEQEGVDIRVNPSDQELIQLYSGAKVYCHPRIAEHFGLTPVEAMSQGVPVVAYDSGGIRETISHGETGFLASSDEELINYVVQMLTLEDGKWMEMQSKAVAKAHEFSPDRFVESFRTLAMSDKP
jgi:glycosyltransferase involved in cell wall biosynthesis